MSRVRLLHIHSAFNLGGKEARTAKLMNHFGDEAEHVILISDQQATDARNAVSSHVTIDFPGDSAPLISGSPSLNRYRQLASYMKQFDLVLTYNWGAINGVMAHTLLSRKMGLPPLIHHEDGFNEDEATKLNWKRNYFRILALSRSHSLVVPSIQLEKIALTAWKQPAEKVIRIGNGIDVKRYLRPAEPDAFPGFVRNSGEVVVGTIAGLREVKNLPRLVRAVACAGPNVRLAIAGTGPELAKILAEAKRLGISDRVLLPGFLAEPERYVGLFDIFALSSDSEQFPISLVEGMAAGCPVVATDVGDIRSIVAEKNRDFIVQRDDEAALAGSIRKLAIDSTLRQELGNANAAKALAEYDERLMFSRYRNLYGSAMKRDDWTSP